MKAALFAAALLTGLTFTSPAGAADATDLPTLEDIHTAAVKAKADAVERVKAANRDPRKEALAAYRSGATPLDQFQPLAEMINNSKDAAMSPYRQAAAQALLARFKVEDANDPFVRKSRAGAGLAILDLMKASSSDTVGLSIVGEVLNAWWRSKVLSDVKFKPTDKFKNRMKAYRKMRSYLQSGEKE